MDKKILEDIKNHIEENHPEEKEQKESTIKKIFLISISLFLVFLMISYVFVSFPIGKIIRGQLESSPIEDGIIKLPNFNIVFNENTFNQLTTIYLNEQKVEFSVCLSGEKITNKKKVTYQITSLYRPKVYQQSFSHVSFAPCPVDSLIMLHSHPYKSCLASQTDLDTLNKSKEENPDLVMVVMCESKRFSVYQ